MTKTKRSSFIAYVYYRLWFIRKRTVRN